MDRSGTRRQEPPLKIADFDAIALQVPLQAAALALVRRSPREVGSDLGHGERAKLGSGVLVQTPPDGIEAVAQQMVGAVARFEREVAGDAARL